MVYVFGWFVLSLLVGLAAGKRGRGSGNWFVLSALISPLLAALALALVPDLTQVQQAKLSRPCPACAETVLRAASVCKHCGAALTPVRPDPETAWEKLTKMR